MEINLITLQHLNVVLIEVSCFQNSPAELPPHDNKITSGQIQIQKVLIIVRKYIN